MRPPTRKAFYIFGPGWADRAPSNELFRSNLARAPLTLGEDSGTPDQGRFHALVAPMILDAPGKRLVICGGDAGNGNSISSLGGLLASSI